MLGFIIPVWIRLIGELVVNSTIVLPVQPTWAITVSLVRLPNQNITDVRNLSWKRFPLNSPLIRSNPQQKFSIIFLSFFRWKPNFSLINWYLRGLSRKKSTRTERRGQQMRRNNFVVFIIVFFAYLSSVLGKKWKIVLFDWEIVRW